MVAMISLGLLSDSNAFRFSKNDESSLFKATFVIDDYLSLPKIQIQTLRDSSGLCWRNPRLADPHLHISALMDSWKSILELRHCKNLLLVTTKDEIYIKILENELPDFCHISYLSQLNSSNLKELDRYSDHFTPQNKRDFDLIFFRHGLEHSMNPLKILKNLSCSLSSKGMIVIEVPLSFGYKKETFLEQFWEEHIFYFSVETLLHLLSLASLEAIDYKVIKTENEPVLAVIAQLKSKITNAIPTKLFDRELLFKRVNRDMDRSRTFFESISNLKDTVLIGANHKSINLIDLLGSKNQRIFLLDGDPQKIGKFATRFDLKVLDIEELNYFKNADIFTTVSTQKLRGIVNNHLPKFDRLHDIKNFYSAVRESVL